MGEPYRRTVDAMLTGPILGMKHAALVMREQRAGVIISTASVAGLKAGYGPHVYTAVKSAVINLTRSVAQELGPFNVRVNAICPGGIATPIFAGQLALSAAATPTMPPPSNPSSSGCSRFRARVNLRTLRTLRVFSRATKHRSSADMRWSSTASDGRRLDESGNPCRLRGRDADDVRHRRKRRFRHGVSRTGLSRHDGTDPTQSYSGFDTPTLLAVLDRDGGVIVEDMFPQALIRRMRDAVKAKRGIFVPDRRRRFNRGKCSTA